MFRFDAAALERLAEKHARSFLEARPYPHVVLDGLFPPEVLDGVLEEFPDAAGIKWKKYSDPRGKKLATRSEQQIGDRTLSLLYQINSSTFIEFLEALTAISGLIPDPHFWGGGLHQIRRDGFLKVHADFNRYERLGLDRRLNVLVYLNREWHEDYGGHLELWSHDMQRCERKILPIFNRCVVFRTTDSAYHGHPEPLQCPPDRSRKSLALYYYTSGRPDEEHAPAHSTLYKNRPGEDMNTVKARVSAFIDRLRGKGTR